MWRRFGGTEVVLGEGMRVVVGVRNLRQVDRWEGEHEKWSRCGEGVVSVEVCV